MTICMILVPIHNNNRGKRYHVHPCKTLQLRFYSSVILNGTETRFGTGDASGGFYSSVILNGTETLETLLDVKMQFYSSVILNGTETQLLNESQFL